MEKTTYNSLRKKMYLLWNQEIRKPNMCDKKNLQSQVVKAKNTRQINNRQERVFQNT